MEDCLIGSLVIHAGADLYRYHSLSNSLYKKTTQTDLKSQGCVSLTNH